MSKRILIKNASAIVSCDAEDNVYAGQDILIEGPKIIKIGENITDEVDEIIDARDKFVYPGMVNTHHHFFQSFVRNLMSIDLNNMTLLEWLETIYKVFSGVNDDVIYYSSLTALTDLIKHGCTTAFDHQYCFTDKTEKAIDMQMEAAKLLGIRYHAGRGTNTLPKEHGSTMPDVMVETTEEYLKDCERVINLYHDTSEFSMNQIVMAPCQIVNCFEDTFTETVKYARKMGVNMHTHIAEGETEAIVNRLGMRTTQWFDEIGFVGKDVWAAHGWELTPEEFDVLGKTGTGISHCPAPAIMSSANIIDIVKMQEAGILVSMGCDGSASNDSSNMLDSLRLAYMAQARECKNRGWYATPYDLLKCSTINGAKTLGRDDLGSLEVGKAADLFMVDIGRLEMVGVRHDPKSMLARVGAEDFVDMTMINGKVVYKDGHLVGIDERKLAKEGEQVCTSVLRDKFEVYPKVY